MRNSQETNNKMFNVYEYDKRHKTLQKEEKQRQQSQKRAEHMRGKWAT